MSFPIPVFSVEEARIKRGENAEVMLACPSCEMATGVLIQHMQRLECCGENADGVAFDIIIWERWHCLSCGNIWIEKYGVAEGTKALI